MDEDIVHASSNRRIYMRETVRFLSFIYMKTKEESLIREDRDSYLTGKQVVLKILSIAC